jgi:cellulose synthase/poly-beta-1,6-N-acetylglucosamine synthase-like glycosyltransferase
MAKPKNDFKPKVCVVMPCKGAELGLEKNIEAVLEQSYESYSKIVLVEIVQDPAYEAAASAIARHSASDARILAAESCSRASGKVAALLTALSKTRGQKDVYAFIDTDALVSANWIAELVDPLIDNSIGVTTGFRWYFPLGEGFWPHVQAAWNASGTNSLFDSRYNFPWGVWQYHDSIFYWAGQKAQPSRVNR